MWVLIKVIDPAGVEAAGPSFDSMNLVALLKQQLRQVTSILPRDAGNKSSFRSKVGHLNKLGLLRIETVRQLLALEQNHGADLN